MPIRRTSSPVATPPGRRPADVPTPAPVFTGSGRYPLVPASLEAFCVPIDSLRPDPQNARRHQEKKDIPKLAKLIRIHGFRKPIVVDDNSMIMAGEGAWRAGKLLGMSHIPVARSSFESEAARIGYSVSDNKSHEYSDWNQEVLQELVARGAIPSAEEAGFSAKEWKGLQLSEAPPTELQTVDVAGESRTQGEFIIIRFDSEAQLSMFKEKFGMGKFERAIDFSKLGMVLA